MVALAALPARHQRLDKTVDELFEVDLAAHGKVPHLLAQLHQVHEPGALAVEQKLGLFGDEPAAHALVLSVGQRLDVDVVGLVGAADVLLDVHDAVHQVALDVPLLAARDVLPLERHLHLRQLQRAAVHEAHGAQQPRRQPPLPRDLLVDAQRRVAPARPHHRADLERQHRDRLRHGPDLHDVVALEVLEGRHVAVDAQQPEVRVARVVDVDRVLAQRVDHVHRRVDVLAHRQELVVGQPLHLVVHVLRADIHLAPGAAPDKAQLRLALRRLLFLLALQLARASCFVASCFLAFLRCSIDLPALVLREEVAEADGRSGVVQ